MNRFHQIVLLTVAALAVVMTAAAYLDTGRLTGWFLPAAICTIAWIATLPKEAE